MKELLWILVIEKIFVVCYKMRILLGGMIVQVRSLVLYLGEGLRCLEMVYLLQKVFSCLMGEYINVEDQNIFSIILFMLMVGEIKWFNMKNQLGFFFC